MADPNAYQIGSHPETGQPVVQFDHGHYGVGCLPRKLSAFADSYPPVGLTYPDLPAADWTEQDFRPYCSPVKDQGQTSSCGGFTLTELIEMGFRLQTDLKPVLSPWFAYGVVVRGQDVGSSLPDLLRAGQLTGLPPDSLVRAGDFSGDYDQSVYQAAEAYRIDAAFNAPTFANLCSSAERRMGSCIGIDIGRNFNPDAEGFLPPFESSPEGPLGHAIDVVGKRFARGRWWLLVRNHWTAEWGVGGYAWLPPDYVNPYFGAWTLRVVRPNPSVGPPAA